MDNNTLDNRLAKKDLRQIFSDIRKAGYQNSLLHQKGYIIAKKTNLVKVRIVLDKDENSLVTIMYPGIGDIVFSIFILIIFAVLGGVFLLGFIGYVLVRGISFLVSIPKSREFKTEIENIIG